jgi:uncharacterized ferritin-like protein (DUF455 family)
VNLTHTPDTDRELRQAALAALCVAEPDAKLRAVATLASVRPDADPGLALAAPAGVPGRPERPMLVLPAQLPRRPVGNVEGRCALLHALAHIEFNAINLALDAIWRFPGLPVAYYGDWLVVAAEEAHHFALLRGRLRAAGYDYGDFAAHDGLWAMAERTADDVLARMALVPRTLEARGLDASPAIRARLAAVGDQASAEVLDVILRDEIGHVAVGNRWFRHLCAAQGEDPIRAYRALALRYNAPRLHGPFNVAARKAAGFVAEEIAALGT